MRNILLFGGTFDPVHNGHLNVVKAVYNHFHFQRVLFLPCKIPILKNQAKANPEQRVAMLRLALNECPEYPFEIDERELHRLSPSYTVETLEDFRKQLGRDTSITLLMGADSFATLPMWHQWQRILMLANLLVIHRPGYSRPDEFDNPVISGLLANNQTHNHDELKARSHGLIYCFNAGRHEISSTAIRNRSQMRQALPESVREYIEQYGLYQE